MVKAKKICILLLIISAFTAAFSGCNPESGESGKQEDNICCTVLFDSGGGGKTLSQTVKKGDKVTEPDNPVKGDINAEYGFEGWYYGDNKWVFTENTVSENMVLVARWRIENLYTPEYPPLD